MWTQFLKWCRQKLFDRPYRPGSQIGPYRVEKVLGLGSYGIAYLARRAGERDKVVLKQVRPSLRNTPKGAEMQAYERKVLELLSHPQIPRCLDSFAYRNDSFIVLTYLEGPTLEDILFEENIQLDEYTAARYMRKLGEVVAYLHTKGIIHRDVRIPNVIWKDDLPYLIDFGLARLLGDAPAYTAEDLTGYPLEKQLKREVAPSSDLYALGHFFLFLLYSSYTAEDDAAERSWEEELTLSPAIRQMIRTLLQIDPGYASVNDWLADLDAYLYSSAVQA
jgi:serine/threonine-protein kinase